MRRPLALDSGQAGLSSWPLGQGGEGTSLWERPVGLAVSKGLFLFRDECHQGKVQLAARTSNERADWVGRPQVLRRRASRLSPRWCEAQGRQDGLCGQLSVGSSRNLLLLSMEGLFSGLAPRPEPQFFAAVCPFGVHMPRPLPRPRDKAQCLGTSRMVQREG